MKKGFILNNHSEPNKQNRYFIYLKKARDKD